MRSSDGDAEELHGYREWINMLVILEKYYFGEVGDLQTHKMS